MELKNGIKTYCPHCDEPFTMYPFGQQVIDTAELDALRQRVEALEAERDEALRQNAEAAPLMDAYRDLVVAWHQYDKAQPAQGLFEQLEAITSRVALNNAGVATLARVEALEAVLRPFARIYEAFPQSWAETRNEIFEVNGTVLDYTDFFAAYHTLHRK